MAFVKVEYYDDVTPLSAETFNDLQDRIKDAIDNVEGGSLVGMPLFIQATAPIYTAGPYAWFDTAAFTLWIEDGV